jgi:hypothetical protein
LFSSNNAGDSTEKVQCLKRLIQSQGQLTVRTEVSVDERPYRRGQVTGKIGTAHNFQRDILRGILGPMFGGVKRNDPNRVAVLAGHQIVDGGFEIGLARASSWRRSEGVTVMEIPVRMRQIRVNSAAQESFLGFKCRI